MAPHISIRDFIRMPAAANAPNMQVEEPTYTLVLTSSQNRFIDIRILQSGPEPIPRIAKDAAILPFSHLDWAFAGTSSSSTTKHVQDGSSLLRSTWTHWIDSRATNAERLRDEGFMFPQTDGRTLEKGSMIDPKTGWMEDYEEMWKDVAATNCGDKSGRVKCAVLIMESTRLSKGNEEKARGMVVRVGQFCQGIVRVGDGLALERWEWKEEGGWKRSCRMGDMFLPCGVAMDFDRLQLGGKVSYEGLMWFVAELEEN